MMIKAVSSLEKCFLDETINDKAELKSFSAFKNEIYSLQVCFSAEMNNFDAKTVFFSVESPISEYIKTYLVKNMPSEFPLYPASHDEDYLRKTPGLFPDLLEEITDKSRLQATNSLKAVWVEIGGNLPAGTYPISFSFKNEKGEVLAETKVEAEIINEYLPKEDFCFTQWFYTDCLSDYYKVEPFSEEHWKIIGSFMENYRRYGGNMILTPILSPALDIYKGGYRTPTQLVEITVENGEYSFDFSRLSRWIDLCDEKGIKFFEINHLFTQWGAEFCPQVLATVNGEKKRIFGWETKSDGEEYRDFLSKLIPSLIKFMKSKNADNRLFFHMSDEPSPEHLERFKSHSEFLEPLLSGYPIMDAISNIEFCLYSAIKYPVAANDHIEPFIENNVPNLWTYYCCVQSVDVSNRFFSEPSYRNRIIGTQFYKFGIKGFLHWGYNFYNNRFSYNRVNPFTCTDGECFSPSGDTFSVYPGENGKPLPSLRQVVFNEALQDLRALKLYEKYFGKDETMKLLEEGIEPITFKKYPRNSEYILNLREKLNKKIKEAI